MKDYKIHYLLNGMKASTIIPDVASEEDAQQTFANVMQYTDDDIEFLSIEEYNN